LKKSQECPGRRPQITVFFKELWDII
jgi:hypothetical protein